MPRIALVVVGLLVSNLAHAGPVDRDAHLLAYFVDTARGAAARGDCDDVALLGSRVRAIDAAYYAAAFTFDPALAPCFPEGGDSATQSPATAFAATLGSSALGLATGTTFVVLGGMSLGSNHVGGVALFAAGGAAYAFGPSLGRLYDGHPWNWWLAVRAVAISLPVLGFGLDLGKLTPRVVDGPPYGLTLGMLIGSGLYTIGMLGDIGSAPFAAAANNARAHHDVAIAPLRTRDATGLAVVGRF